MRLFDSVVWSFFGDDHVVYVTLAETGRGDSQEPRFFLKIFNVRCSAVAHACSQPAHELEYHLGKRTFVGNAALDTLGYEFAPGFLRVAVGTALRHGAQGAHSAIALKRAALVENRLAGAFLGTREQAADHDAIRARRDGFR